MIALKDCEHGCVYEIHSRNLTLGVFNSKTAGFTGLREKFGDTFLFEEFHRDTGAPYGTVTPIRKIEKCPVSDLRSSLGTTCGTCKLPVRYVGGDPGFDKKQAWQKFWTHEGSDCGDIRPGSPRNVKLSKYLKKLQACVAVSKNQGDVKP